MTAQSLSLMIFMVIAIQIGIFALTAFYRHWLSYEKLKRRLTDLEENPQKDVHSNTWPEASIPPPWSGFDEFKVQRKVFENADKTICSVYLNPVNVKPLPPFKPGQFLTFKLNIKSKDAEEVVRCYSLSDRPNSEYYRITVKKVLPPSNTSDVPPGKGSNFFHENVHEGDILAVKAPAGHFYLNSEENTPVVLIGGGIGITPMLSMLNTMLNSDSQREIWFYYGVRNSEDQVMKEYLESLEKTHQNLHVYICYSRPGDSDIQGEDYHHSGHVDITLLRMTLLLKPYHFYICGPEPMLATLVPDLEAWGVHEDNIHYETFGPSSFIKQKKNVAVDLGNKTVYSEIIVAFSESGKTFQWNNNAESLLEFAEENGISMPSGCRAGSCGSCQISIVSGEVEYNQSPDIDPESGTCLTCVSKPKTNLTLSA